MSMFVNDPTCILVNHAEFRDQNCFICCEGMLEDGGNISASVFDAIYSKDVRHYVIKILIARNQYQEFQLQELKSSSR